MENNNRSHCAIIGDVVGSRFERHNHKNKDVELFTKKNHFTDNTVMTLAVADAIMDTSALKLVFGQDDAAIEALLEGDSFEDVIRHGIPVGRDSDTIASMAGAIASVYYKDIPDELVVKILTYLTDDLRASFTKWQSIVG